MNLERIEYLCEDMAKKLLIELPYLGNIAFYQFLTRYDEVYIEKHEYFQKASFRNRCEVAGPNGRLTLSVPVVGGKDKKQFYSDACISYEHPWVKDHWNSLTAGYRRSPYFEFYEDKFEQVFSRQHALLFDFNLDLFQLTLNLLKLPIEVKFTSSYQPNPAAECDDYRSYFLPKKKQDCDIHYPQVFGERTGFLSNLSIVDLLFNEGPHSLQLIKSVV